MAADGALAPYEHRLMIRSADRAARPLLRPIRSTPMVRRPPTSPLDHGPDDPLTFADVTLLALLAVSGAALAAVLLLGTLAAAHRIAAEIVLW